MTVFEQAVRERVEAGVSIADIIKETGFRKIDILRLCSKIGLLKRLVENGKPPGIVVEVTPSGQIVHRPERRARTIVKEERLRGMVAAGMRAKQIAFECGVTTQAVYASLKRYGLVIEPRPLKRDMPKMSHKYGMPMEKVRHLRSIGATRAYTEQKRNARNRGIEWKLTFAEWWDLWDASGKWQDRGCHKGGWVMGRHGDIGAYEVGNVSICTLSENAKERAKHAPPLPNLQHWAGRYWKDVETSVG